MCITIFEIDHQSRFDALDMDASVHWNDPEGWDEEGRGRGVEDGGHMYTHG